MTGERRRIELVKTSGVLGPAPVGERYGAQVSADLSDDEARVRAYRMLKRDRPEENAMCWTVAPDDSTGDR